MNEHELKNIWKSQDQKIDHILSINKSLIIEMTQLKLDKEIKALVLPKTAMIILGLPYTFILISISFITFLSGAYFMTFGFGIIALIMIATIVVYLYHIYLIQQISKSEDVLQTQEHLSKLKLSSYNCVRLAIFQIPFWSICWMSINALIESPLIYGGINLIIFSGLSYFSYWLYKELDANKKTSKVRDFLLSDNEWKSIEKSNQLLEQIKEYQEIH